MAKKKINPNSIKNLKPATDEVRKKAVEAKREKKAAKLLLQENFDEVAKILSLPPKEAAARLANPKNQMEEIIFSRLLNFDTSYNTLQDLTDRVLGKPKLAVDLDANINEDAGLLIKFDDANANI